MKKTSKAKNLLLSTERIRNLRPDELRGAVGGACNANYSLPPPPPPPCDTCTVTTIQCQYTNNPPPKIK